MDARDCLRSPHVYLCLAALFTSGGCSEVRHPPPPGDSALTLGEGTTSTTSAEETGADPMDTGPLLDLGDHESTAGLTDECPVDFLFVLDNSSSMKAEQELLIASFPGFTQIIADALGRSDFHVMVSDTDPHWNRCAQQYAQSPADCMELHALPSIECVFNGFDVCTQGTPTPCDNQAGAGVIYPTSAHVADDSASNLPCDVPEGQRYLDPSSDDLAADFACIASLGINGAVREEPLDELSGAIALSQPGACNQGFLRDDAILVVTLVTDDVDTESEATWEQVRDQLVAAKGGQEQGVVFMALLPHASCDNGGDQSVAPRLESLVSSFSHHAIEPVCSPDYSVPLAALLADIELSCEQFNPL